MTNIFKFELTPPPISHSVLGSSNLTNLYFPNRNGVLLQYEKFHISSPRCKTNLLYRSPGIHRYVSRSFALENKLLLIEISINSCLYANILYLEIFLEVIYLIIIYLNIPNINTAVYITSNDMVTFPCNICNRISKATFSSNL